MLCSFASIVVAEAVTWEQHWVGNASCSPDISQDCYYTRSQLYFHRTTGEYL